jgi:hypothetical protein
MKFTNPWIDPRITQVRPESAQAYLLEHGWKRLGPASNPDLLRFEGPGGGDDAPLVLLPLELDEGPLLQRMIDLVGEVASFEERWAADVITDLLKPHSDPVEANGLLRGETKGVEVSGSRDKEQRGG